MSSRPLPMSSPKAVADLMEKIVLLVHQTQHPTDRIVALAAALQFEIHAGVDTFAARKTHREVGIDAIDYAERMLAGTGVADELAKIVAPYVEPPPGEPAKPGSPWVKPTTP